MGRRAASRHHDCRLASSPPALILAGGVSHLAIQRLGADADLAGKVPPLPLGWKSALVERDPGVEPARLPSSGKNLHLEPCPLQFPCEGARPGLGEIWVRKETFSQIGFVEGENARRSYRHRVAMIGVRIQGRFRQNGACRGPLENQRRSVALVPDEVDDPRMNKMHRAHGVAEMEKELSCLKGKLPAPKTAKMAFEFVEHDRDHVRIWRKLARYPLSKEPLMLRMILYLALLLPVQAYAQAGHHPMAGMPTMPGGPQVSSRPTQPGKGAFAAIQEIVGILEADPRRIGARSTSGPCGSI